MDTRPLTDPNPEQAIAALLQSGPFNINHTITPDEVAQKFAGLTKFLNSLNLNKSGLMVGKYQIQKYPELVEYVLKLFLKLLAVKEIFKTIFQNEEDFNKVMFNVIEIYKVADIKISTRFQSIIFLLQNSSINVEMFFECLELVAKYLDSVDKNTHLRQSMQIESNDTISNILNSFVILLINYYEIYKEQQ
jgi:hypothetical protein